MLAPSRHADAVDYTGAMLCELPAGWVTTTLGNLVGIVRGVTYKKMDARSESEQGLVPILRATNIGQALSFQDLVYVPDKYVKYEQMLRLGDIVIAASSGSRAVVGKAAQLRHDWTGSFGAFCFALRPDRGLIKEYIAWFLQTQEYRTRVSELSAGVNINNLKREHIEETTIPLPPITEQRRIVAEIEKQFTRLDASVAALKRVQANLERYRASVLKAACEGALVPTEAELARSEGRDYEPADRLLERVLSERRVRWNPQENRGRKYKEPIAPDTSGLPELSEGWVWSGLDQLITILKNGFSKRPQGKSGTAILRISAVRAMSVNLQDIRWVSDADRPSEFLVHPGDLLFTRYNGNPSLVGVCGVVPSLDRNTLHPDKLIRASLTKNGALPNFVQIVANSGVSREFLAGRIRTTAGQSGISGSDLKSMPLPLPPLAEQRRIVAEVERRLSVIQQAEVAVEANLARAERLRQSILKQAFSGKLVPQDPDDEPASVLLERIRAEREAAEAAAKSNRKPSRRRSRKSRKRQPAHGEVAS